MTEWLSLATGQAILLLVLTAVWLKRSVYGPQKGFARLTCALLALSLAAFASAGENRDSLIFQVGGISLLLALAIGLIALIFEIAHFSKEGQGGGG